MGFRPGEWALEQDGSATERHLLLIIATQANESGQAILGQRELAAYSGLGESTVRRNLGQLQERGLLRRRPRFREDGGREEDEIHLAVDPPAQTPAQSGRGGRSERAASVRADERPGTTTTSSSSSAREARAWPLQVEEVSPALKAEAEALHAGKPRVGGRLVSWEEMVLAATCMDEFNRQADTSQGLGPNLPAIIGRVREHPTWDGSKHRRLVQSAFRVRWWERGSRNGRALRPNVIYGNTQCFANVAADAGDEAAGKQEKIEQRRGRFDRKVTRDE